MTIKNKSTISVDDAYIETLSIFRELKMSVPEGFIFKVIESNSFNDAAHNLDHIMKVVRDAKNILKHFNIVNKQHVEVVMLGALCHDLGCRHDREMHHIISGDMFKEMCLNHYPEIHLGVRNEVVKACIEHRSSYDSPRSGILQEYVALADKGKPDIQNYCLRTVLYRIENGFDDKYQIVDEGFKHLKEKFGPDGYEWKNYPSPGHEMYSEAIQNLKACIEEEMLIKEILFTQAEHFLTKIEEEEI